ncbi:MAG: fasciclin domain-containing protein [Rhodothermaceae bacterium]|nr:fasciclin domain-containing protein [Rhodothermaceae bacterium]
MFMRSLLAAALVLGLALPAAAADKNPTPAPAKAVVHNDIVDLAVATESLSTLVAAVQAAGLVETLKSDGPFTVFAPTNEAFARLGQDTIESLLRPENRDQLVAILTYHVVAGEFDSFDLQDERGLTTVNGQDLSIGVGVNDARFAATDIQASNGIVHVIDRVLLPREMEQASQRQNRSHH